MFVFLAIAFALALSTLSVHHIETVHLQQDYQRIFAGKKHIHIADNLILEYDEHAKDQKGQVL